MALLEDVKAEDFPVFDSNQAGNLVQARVLLTNLTQAPELASYLRPLLSSGIFETHLDSLYLGSDSAEEVKAALGRLAIVTLREALQLHAAPPSEESIVIKLPDPADFAEALKFSEQFHIAIEQVISHPAINGHAKLKAWEFGSFWLYLALSGQALRWP